jgi:hypothetical protein
VVGQGQSLTNSLGRHQDELTEKIEGDQTMRDMQDTLTRITPTFQASTVFCSEFAWWQGTQKTEEKEAKNKIIDDHAGRNTSVPDACVVSSVGH